MCLFTHAEYRIRCVFVNVRNESDVCVLDTGVYRMAFWSGLPLKDELVGVFPFPFSDDKMSHNVTCSPLIF